MKKILIMFLTISVIACSNEESTDSADTYRNDSTVIERENTIISDTTTNRTDTMKRLDSVR